MAGSRAGKLDDRSRSYYFTSVIHAFVAPLAIFELMTRKLTLLDLTLDRDLYRQHFIARKAYEALRSDFNLTDRRYPLLVFSQVARLMHHRRPDPALFPRRPNNAGRGARDSIPARSVRRSMPC